jgi:EmrB/QacA subfamily drug resistance transporter
MTRLQQRIGDPTRKQRLRWWTLAVVSVTLVISALDETIINVALPTLQRDLDASASGLQWMVNAYILAFGGLLLIMGGLGDRFGRARMLRVGLTVFGLASLAAAYVDTTGQLIVARAAMGAGAAMMMPATLSIIVDVFRGEERSKAISIWAALAGIGLFLGPILGGLLLRNFWWGSVFLANVPIAIVALVATILVVPESRDPESKPLDVPGAILSTAAISSLIYAIIEGPDKGWTSWPILLPLGSALVLGGAFAAWEKRTPYPLLDFGFFRRARFSTGAVAISLSFFAMAGLIFGLTQFLQFVQGYSPLEAGYRFLPAAVGLAVGAMGSEKLVLRFGTTAVVTAGMVALAATLPLLLLWGVGTGYLVVATVITLIGVAAAMVFAPATEAVMGAVPEEQAGVASATNDITRLMAGALGIAVIGAAMYSFYSSRIADAVVGLPVAVAAAAQDSVGAALQIAETLPNDVGTALAVAAREAFTDAFGLAVLIGAAIALLGIGVVATKMPPRPQPLPESTRLEELVPDPEPGADDWRDEPTSVHAVTRAHLRRTQAVIRALRSLHHGRI